MQKEIRRRPAASEPLQFSSAISSALANIYAVRGVFSDDQLAHELTRLDTPDTFKGLSAAAKLIADAIEQQQSMLIIGDFDADGATSTALSVLALRAMGAAKVDFLVPNRFEYGYGLTPEIVAVAATMKPDLIITVDNGISSCDGVEAANTLGIRVLVTDHHLPGKQIPEAACIVNPNQPGCEFPSKYLAGVGVIFYVLSACAASCAIATGSSAAESPCRIWRIFSIWSRSAPLPTWCRSITTIACWCSRACGGFARAAVAPVFAPFLRWQNVRRSHCQQRSRFRRWPALERSGAARRYVARHPVPAN